MKRNKQVSFRLNDKELRDFKKLVKESGLNQTNFFISCISNDIRKSVPIKLKSLKPPPTTPKSPPTTTKQPLKKDFGGYRAVMKELKLKLKKVN